MKVTDTIEIEGEEHGVYHIPGVHNMQQTLCGFVDASGYRIHNSEHNPCNCRKCIEALTKIKSMRFPKDYFKKDAP